MAPLLTFVLVGVRSVCGDIDKEDKLSSEIAEVHFEGLI